MQGPQANWRVAARFHRDRPRSIGIAACPVERPYEAKTRRQIDCLWTHRNSTWETPTILRRSITTISRLSAATVDRSKCGRPHSKSGGTKRSVVIFSHRRFGVGNAGEKNVLENKRREKFIWKEYREKTNPVPDVSEKTTCITQSSYFPDRIRSPGLKYNECDRCFSCSSSA